MMRNKEGFITSSNHVMVCDKCNAEFPTMSVSINECSVEIGGKTLLLTYFACPKCKSIYKVLLVKEDVYRRLLDDFLLVKKRIRKLQGKGNQELLERLQSMATVKSNKIKAYVAKMNKQYPGTFTFVASENNQKEVGIIYLP